MFVDSFDATYAIHHNMEKMIQKNIPLNVVKDSDSIFKVIVKSSRTTENA